MTIRARLEAFWLAWKYVLLLAIALALSLYGNYRQFRSAIEAPLKGQIAAKDEALDDSAALLADMRSVAGELYLAGQRATANLNEASTEYRREAGKRPLGAGCAPGQGRQNAINRTLSGASNPETTK